MLINLMVLATAGTGAAVIAAHGAIADIVAARAVPVAPGLRKVSGPQGATTVRVCSAPASATR